MYRPPATGMAANSGSDGRNQTPIPCGRTVEARTETRTGIRGDSPERPLIEDGAEGRVRVRVLPESRRQEVNASAWRYEVRGEEGEDAIAEKPAALGQIVVNPEFRFAPIEQEERTQW